ncbi:MAG: hypothetical protein K2H43_05815, partial [Clostridia bacterium]|nr:hypothetical protein [Clostridia bacterium]
MSKQGKGTLGKKAGMAVSLLAVFATASLGAVGCRRSDPVPPDPIVTDTEAPRLRTAPKDITTQVGLYTGLGGDLAAVDAVDNETARVEVYPKSITFGSQTRLLGKDDKSVYLAEAGEYTL